MTLRALVAPGDTVPVFGVALNQSHVSPCACARDNWVIAVVEALIESDQCNGSKPGLLIVSDCSLLFGSPSVVAKESSAGGKARTAPALGGNGRTVMSTSMC